MIIPFEFAHCGLQALVIWHERQDVVLETLIPKPLQKRLN